MPRALISVSDKTGLTEFANALVEMGWELVASGGSETALRQQGIAVTPINQLTGLPEMLGGRVKTLHPAIHAGILARDRSTDLDEISEYGYAPISMVVCNLYPFQQTVARSTVTLQDAVEQIDIGGVALLRASAKNFFRVITLCDPSDYGHVVAALRATGQVDLALRRNLAIKAFSVTRDYDTAIHSYLAQGTNTPSPDLPDLPQQISLAMYAVESLRYGENPHQSATYYARQATDAPLGATQLGGKQLSYNNILDVDAAWRAVSGFQEPTVVIVKHLNPTGIASARNITEAFPLALASDELSAFGGIIAVNQVVDEPFAEALGTLFVEVIVAPAFTRGSIEMLNSKRANCRLLQMSHPYDGADIEIRSVHRGLLAQRADMGDPDSIVFRSVTERTPSPEELATLQFAWKAVQHVKSNAIVLAQPGCTVGIGGGLSSRVDSVELAVKKAGERAIGAVLASDAFFPFADGIQVAIDAGVIAIIQPGGSIRDAQVIDAANKAGIAMVFTGIRHFRH